MPHFAYYKVSIRGCDSVVHITYPPHQKHYPITMTRIVKRITYSLIALLVLAAGIGY